MIAALAAVAAAYRIGGQAAVVIVLFALGIVWLRSRARTTWAATRFSPAVWLLFAVAAVTVGLLVLMVSGGAAGVLLFLFFLSLTVGCMAQANRSADGR